MPCTAEQLIPVFDWARVPKDDIPVDFTLFGV